MPKRCYIITDQHHSLDDIWQTISRCDSDFSLSLEDRVIYVGWFDWQTDTPLAYLNLQEVVAEDTNDFSRLLYNDKAFNGKSRAFYCWFNTYRLEPGGNPIFPWLIEGLLQAHPVKVLVGFRTVLSGSEFVSKVRHHPAWDWNCEPVPA